MGEGGVDDSRRRPAAERGRWKVGRRGSSSMETAAPAWPIVEDGGHGENFCGYDEVDKDMGFFVHSPFFPSP